MTVLLPTKITVFDSKNPGVDRILSHAGDGGKHRSARIGG